jgi:hypothetical protein
MTFIIQTLKKYLQIDFYQKKTSLNKLLFSLFSEKYYKMDDSEINFYMLNSEDAIIEITNNTPETMLQQMMKKVYQTEDSYKIGQNDRAILAK